MITSFTEIHSILCGGFLFLFFCITTLEDMELVALNMDSVNKLWMNGGLIL